MDEQKERKTDRQPYRQTKVKSKNRFLSVKKVAKNKWKDRQMDRQTNGRRTRWTVKVKKQYQIFDRKKIERKIPWTNGQTERKTCTQTDRQTDRRQMDKG